MSKLAEELSEAAEQYQRDRYLARLNFSPIGVGKSTGRRRDQAEAKAKRIYKARLARVSQRAAWRAR